MKVFQLVILSILTVACCVGALFLYLLWSIKSPQLAVPNGVNSIDVLAINMTMLQIVLALVGFLIAIVGVFGYTGIKSAATSAAEAEARREINSQMVKWKREKEASNQDSQSENEGDFSGIDASVADAVPAGKEE